MYCLSNIFIQFNNFLFGPRRSWRPFAPWKCRTFLISLFRRICLATEGWRSLPQESDCPFSRTVYVFVFYFCINHCVASTSPRTVITVVPGLVGEMDNSSDPLDSTSIARRLQLYNNNFFMFYLNMYLPIIVLSR